MIDLKVESTIPQFEATLQRYMGLVEKLPAVVIAEKARDLSIRLWSGFSDHKFGGPGKKKRGLARAELDRRSSEGRGIRVRAELVAKFRSERALVVKPLRSIGQRLRRRKMHGTADQISNLTEERASRRSVRAHMWRNIVEAELWRRQQGIGALGASFLLFRNRYSQARGKYQVKNKTGKPMGEATISDKGLLIEGFTEGLRLIDGRYNIVAQALEGSRAHMQVYITDKENEARGIFENKRGKKL
jgi:hypothetical protein